MMTKSMQILIYFFIGLFTRDLVHVLADCPDPKLLTPCICIKDQIFKHGIYCGGNTAINFTQIFSNLSKSLPKNKKHFDRFHLNNTFVTELSANLTLDLTFNDITIEQAKNLKFIDENTFGETVNVSTSLRIFYNQNLENHISLFGAIKKFKNIVVLSLDFNNITEIPSDGLSRHDWLEDITIRGHSIRKIGENTFKYLRILNTLEITQTNIDYIPENAFNFLNRDKGGLVFIFNDNNRINSSSFAANSLSHFQQRAVDFYYLSKTKEQRLQYLDEKTFLPFLLANNRSIVSTLGHTFDCNDCRSYWLVKNPNLKHRVNDFVCADGKPFTDKTHFTNCQN